MIPQTGPTISLTAQNDAKELIDYPYTHKKDCALWQSHEVKSEFVGLLDLIIQEYPETFAQLTLKMNKIWTMKLNMLCSLVNAFTKTSMTEFDTELLTEYGRGTFYRLAEVGIEYKLVNVPLEEY